MQKTFSIAILFSCAVVVSLSSQAEAFHCWAIRGYYGNYTGSFSSPCFIPGCGQSYGCMTCCGYGVAAPACAQRHCIGSCIRSHCAAKQARHAARWNAAACGGYGSCGGYGGCGYTNAGCGNGGSPCGFGSFSYACGPGAWGACACGSGCFSDGSTGGCSGCTGGAPISNESGETIYEGPAGGEVIQGESARFFRRSPFRLASQSQRNGSAAFDQGVNSFRSHSLNDALRAFDAAISAEPNNALFRYYRALTLYELGGAQGGNDALAQAIEIERDQPVSNWGRHMERVQGKNRVWVENARRAAGLTR